MKSRFLDPIRTVSVLFARIALGMLALCASAHADAVFNFNVNTGSLGSNPSGPFYLDFQFNDGGILGNNTARVGDFQYFGGSAIGSPAYFGGGVSGNLGSSVLFNNSATFQEFYQGFTPGTRLSFDVFLTTAVDGITPDAFSFAILDGSLFNIPTTFPGDALAMVNINGPSPLIQTFQGTGAYSGVTTVGAPVPEPGSFALLLTGLPLLFLLKRMKATV